MGKIQYQLDDSGQFPAWFAVFTQHRHEKSVAHALEGKGKEVFLPLYTTTHRWKDRVKRLSLPLFPNYVFVFCSIVDRATILSTLGIYDFVRIGGGPAAISREEIESIRDAVEYGRHIEPHPFLKSGDRVRVRSGPLEGIEGLLVRKKNFYRLVLSVELLERSVSVEVEVADVERVAEGRRVPPSKGTFVRSRGGY